MLTYIPSVKRCNSLSAYGEALRTFKHSPNFCNVNKMQMSLGRLQCVTADCYGEAFMRAFVRDFMDAWCACMRIYF